MRRSIATAVIVWILGAAVASAQCADPAVTPERSGTIVTIKVDFCPSQAGPASPGATLSPAPAAATPASPSPLVTDLYRQWPTLTSPGAAPATAAPNERADLPAINGAFSLPRDILGTPKTEEIKGVRIDERDHVSVRLTHFNFVNFAPEYTVEKTVIEAYVTLNKLWSQALGLGMPLVRATAAATGPCSADATFEQCVIDWMWAQILTSRQLDAATGKYKARVALDQASIDNHVKPDSATMQVLRAQLAQVQSDTLTRKPTSIQEIEWYNQVQASHDKLIGQIDAYLRLAELTITGQTKNIDKQAGGTLVTVKMTATNAVGSPAGKPVEIQYFVHSKYPVTFHAGYLYSSLKEVKFEQVRTIAGADLFQQVQDPTGVNTYAAFLSYRLISGNTGRHGTGVLATLGTDFKNPGSRVYVGGSVRFLSRVYVGVGLVSASVLEGQNRVVEQLGTALGARELFTAVTARRDWKPYFHLSFGVFN